MSVTCPSSAQNGDLLVLWFIQGGSGWGATVTAPSGWTNAQQSFGNYSHTLNVAYYRISSLPAGPWTFTFSSNTLSWTGVVAAYGNLSSITDVRDRMYFNSDTPGPVAGADSTHGGGDTWIVFEQDNCPDPGLSVTSSGTNPTKDAEGGQCSNGGPVWIGRYPHASGVDDPAFTGSGYSSSTQKALSIWFFTPQS